MNRLDALRERLSGLAPNPPKPAERINNDAPASQKHDTVNPEIEQRLRRVEVAVGSFDQLNEDNRQ